MSEINPYLAPQAEVATSHPGDSQIEFFPTSKTKLVVLYFATFGTYPLYWFYKHWSLQKKKTGEKMNPVLRSIFYVFFTHELFKKIEQLSIAKGITKAANAGMLATIFVLLTIVNNVLDRLVGKTESAEVTDYVTFGVMCILVFPLISMQDLANKVNNDPNGDLNGLFSIYNYLFIFAGSIIWLGTLSYLLSIDLSVLVVQWFG